MKRRRILVALSSVSLLALLALFLPALDQAPPPHLAPPPGPVRWPEPPADTAHRLLPPSSLAAEAAAPNAVAQASALQDVDPHKAFGSKNAPVVIEEFSDYQCPACKTLYTTTNRLLMDNYVTTGKVYLLHRDFPLAMHAHSREIGRAHV